MSPDHLRVVIVLYCSALIPLLLLPYLNYRKVIPNWSLKFYVAIFFVCAFGWEIWFTYGIFDGDPVDARRAATLSQMIPMHINWLLNSLADAGSITMGGLLLTWLVFKRNGQIFRKWDWRVFSFLFLIFMGQNIFVEMFLYHDQLAAGKQLSWAPFAPLGPWFNPTLFEYNGRTISLQGQVPWILLTPLIYFSLIRFLNKIEK